MKLKFWKKTQDLQKQLEFEEQRLEQVKDRWPVVHEVAEGMRERLMRNHFAEAIGKAMGLDR